MDGQDFLHKISWKSAALSSEPLYFLHVLFVAPESGCTATLERYRAQLDGQGYTSTVVSGTSQVKQALKTNTIVVHLPEAVQSTAEVPNAAIKSCCNLIALAQTVLDHNRSRHDADLRLFSIVSRDWGLNDLVSASIHGLARALKMEIPTVFGGLVEETDDRFPIAALQYAQGFDYVKVIDGVPQVAALEKLSRASITSPPLHLDRDSSYLITGGTKGVGLQIALWLSQHGAKNLILVSRSGSLDVPSATRSNNLCERQKLDFHGAKVMILDIDMGTPTAAADLSARIADIQMPPVKGVVHAAGIAKYNNVSNCGPQDVIAVMTPKVQGAMALEQVFPPGTLEFFLLTSSFGQLVGFPGQLGYAPANSFLDGLAQYRRRQGDNIVSIQWTTWNGVGMAAQNASVERLVTKGMDARGFDGINKDEAYNALAAIMSDLNHDHVAVVRLKDLVGQSVQRHTLLAHLSEPIRKNLRFTQTEYPKHAVAIIGMACRSAAGETVEDLWNVISRGLTKEQELNKQRFSDVGPDSPSLWANLMQDVDAFDHKFFKISKRESAALDPHQRLLLETTYHALQSAGDFRADRQKKFEDHEQISENRITGCFIGMSAPDYPLNSACSPPSPYTGVGMLRSFLAGRLSHHFGWTGPSQTIDTACSSAMVAIHQACRAIQAGECSRAIAGGVNLFTNAVMFHALRAAGFLNDKGPCRTFDAEANGYCRGEAVGVVVLKPLESALRDNDDIKGILLGTANNQNISRMGITNPVLESQIALYQRLLVSSGIDPCAISYVEAHGTGTKVGDPTEIEGIRRVFGGRNRGSVVHLGAIKSNVGHAEGASGIISLIKVLLMMQHGKITPQAHFKTLNPHIPALEPDMMAISNRLMDWNDDCRLALVNNYGASGNNAAAIVAAPPKKPSGPTTSVVEWSENAWPVFISAASTISLDTYCDKLGSQLAHGRDASWTVPSIAYALSKNLDRGLPLAFSVNAKSVNELKDQLLDPARHTTVVPKPTSMVLLFSGQSHSRRIAYNTVYDGCRLFRVHVDMCEKTMLDLGYVGLRETVLYGPNDDTDIVLLHATQFAVQYSSAMCWIESGLIPAAICGHSFGEWAALVVSGALSLAAGLKLVTGRASIIRDYWGPDTGAMIAIEDDFPNIPIAKYFKSFQAKYPTNHFDIACHNGPYNYVVAGPTVTMDLLEEFLVDEKNRRPQMRFTKLGDMHAYHSAMADSIVEAGASLSTSVSLQVPTLPFETCHEDSWDGQSGNIIARNTRNPVLFEQSLCRIVDRLGECTFLEAGFGGPIVSMARNALCNRPEKHHYIAVGSKDPIRALSDTTLALWKAGHTEIEYWLFHRTQGSSYKACSVPQYQFEKSRHWLEYLASSGDNDGATSNETMTAFNGLLSRRTTDLPYIRMENPETHETGHLFHINTKSEYYQDLVAGHVVVGTPICPAPVYLELVTLAVLMLPHVCTLQFVPEVVVESFSITTSLGQNPQGEVRLRLNVQSINSWDFAIMSDSTSCRSAVHARGKVSLQLKHTGQETDLHTAENILERIATLQSDPDSDALRGTMVYKAFASMVTYSSRYKGLKYLGCRDLEGIGSIKMPAQASTTSRPNKAVIDPVIMDNFMQVSGAFVQILRHATNEVIEEATPLSYICTGMGRVEPLTGVTGSGSYAVHTKVIEETRKKVVLNAFALDVSTRQLVWSCEELTFTKVHRDSLAEALSTVNSGNFEGIDAHFPPQKLSKATSESMLSAAIDRTRSRSDPISLKDWGVTITNVFSRLQAILSRCLDIAPQDIAEDARLADLGVDSLSWIEISTKISQEFQFEFLTNEMGHWEDVKSLCEYMKSRLMGSMPVNISKEAKIGPNKPIADSPDDIQIFTVVRAIISRALDVPTEMITEETTTAEFEVDSLIAHEILGEIRNEIGVEIGYDTLEAETNIASLCTTISDLRRGIVASRNTRHQESCRTSDSAKGAASQRSVNIAQMVVDTLGRCLDLRVDDITTDTPLESLGIDSLLAPEIVAHLNSKMAANISTENLIGAYDVAALCLMLGASCPDHRSGNSQSLSRIGASGNILNLAQPFTNLNPERRACVKLKITNEATTIHKSFMSVRRNFDLHARKTGSIGYWQAMYPQQLDVVVTFVTEAFEKLGCPLADYEVGSCIAQISRTLPKYDKEVQRLWQILEEACVVKQEGQAYIRTASPLKGRQCGKSGKELCLQLLNDFPAFAPVSALLSLIGPHLADCLTGKTNPVSVLFASDHGRQAVADFYANSPDLRACTEILCDFLSNILQSHRPVDEPFEVLEIGAGSGGTTKHLISILQEAKVPFRYTFTDISAHFVSHARHKLFGNVPQMEFQKLDIEQDPPPRLVGRYHLVVASNCVHATRNLHCSLTNIKKLLRPRNSCLALVELTQRQAWLDLVWGLLDGWWLFNDGRHHPLQSPWSWRDEMLSAGFPYVDWSESSSRESRGVRLIVGMVDMPDSGDTVRASHIVIHRASSLSNSRNLFLFPDGFGRGTAFSNLRQPLCTVSNVSVYAFDNPWTGGIDELNQPRSIEELCGHYVSELKRLQPKGPYMVGGYSLGGVVAFEAVRQLQEQDEEVTKLFLIDTACPTFARSVPQALVDFLGYLNRLEGRHEAHSSHRWDGKSFTLARKQLQSYRTSKLPGMTLPQSFLFSARLGLKGKHSIANPVAAPSQKKIVEWFLDDRDDGPLGWHELLNPISVIRAEGNHSSMLLAEHASQWGPHLAAALENDC